MTNMHVVSSQYWNQVHGYTAEDAKRDLEGMQTMRTLAQNMSYLLKAQTAVNDAGIGKPEYEKRYIRISWIRQVEGDRQKTKLCHLLCVQTGGLPPSPCQTGH